METKLNVHFDSKTSKDGHPHIMKIETIVFNFKLYSSFKIPATG